MHSIDISRAEHRVVNLDGDVDRRELFGNLDENLSLIEEKLDVSIVQRDNSLIIIGQQAGKAEETIKEFVKVLAQGEALESRRPDTSCPSNRTGFHIMRALSEKT